MRYVKRKCSLLCGRQDCDLQMSSNGLLVKADGIGRAGMERSLYEF